MRFPRLVWTFVLLASWAGSTHAATIGANGGFNVLLPNGDGDSVTGISVPGSAGFLGVAFMPGLRLGTSSASGNDFYVDLGLASTSVSSANLTSFQATANYQRAFAPTADASPFFTAGIGALVLADESDTFTNAVIGGAIGVRSLVSQGHGALRGEFRIDYITEDSQGFVGGVALGVKLGFDLIMK